MVSCLEGTKADDARLFVNRHGGPLTGNAIRFDLQVEGGWNSARIADRYCKIRPVDERRRAPSAFAASRRAQSEKRFAEKRSPQQVSALRPQSIA